MLDAAYAEGQLGADEYHVRIARAGAARTLGELSALTADLQSPEVFGSPGSSRRASATSGNSAYPPRTRARATDRAATIAALDVGRADGQLDADEHAAAVELASGAKTLGDLATLVADLQKRPKAPAKPRDSNRRGLLLVAAIVSIVASFIVGTQLVREETVGPAKYANPAPLVFPTPSPTTIAGFIHIRDGLRSTFGDAKVDSITFHPEHASLTRSAQGRDDVSVSYLYRGGYDRGDQVSARKRDVVAIDLSEVNTDALAATLKSAATTLRVPDGKIQHFTIDIDSSSKGPKISVYVGNDLRQSAHLTTALSGEILRAYPFEA
ncbi:hypothetical protein GCM10011591_26900 [Nocardia camponoti]|uniref:DUF1707 domain-containing protein n=1 Tax=Nocardia camponoti TaxID=1616106 RepID=A0A917QJI5_9NOCA|nr:hypothetical protein GCM10011591_26900 [Nocardia camponoti]